MNFVFLISIILLTAGYSCYNTEQASNFRDYKLIVPQETTELTSPRSILECPWKCEASINQTAMVQTVSSDVSNVSAYLRDDLSAIFYYRCNMSHVERNLAPRHHYSFMTMCGNTLVSCTQNRQRYNWASIGAGEQRSLDIFLRLPHHVSELKIETKRCEKAPLTFEFRRENNLLYYNYNSGYSFDGTLFSTRNLSESPIKVTMLTAEQDTVANVNLYLQRGKCQDGWQHPSNHSRGYKCFLEISGKSVEGGYVSSACTESDQQRVFGGDVCGYYGGIQGPVCSHKCYNMLACSYLCAVENDGVQEEGGYLLGPQGVAQPGLKEVYSVFPERIGSKPWPNTELPPDLVLVNECAYGQNMCMSGIHLCQDKKKGFSCLEGEINMPECLNVHRMWSYWQCPQNIKSIDVAIRSPDLLSNESNSKFYMKEIMSILKQSEHTKDELRMIIDVMDATFNLPSKEKKTFSTFLLARFRDSYIQFQGKRNKENFSDDSFYYYSTAIEDNKTEVDIPLSPEPSENKTEFIRLDLKSREERTKSASRSRSCLGPKCPTPGSLTAQFFHFKNVDIMNESSAVTANLEKMKRMQDSDISPYEGDRDEDEVLYKNSDMFSLSLDDKEAVEAVKYKLKTFAKAEAYSWLYQVEEVCGFLDEEKDWTWSREGCSLERNGSDLYCRCNHLSNFAMLFSMREINKGHLKAFAVLSLLGGVINVVALFLFLGFILFINSRDKLRIDQLNIAVCLLLGTTIFLCGSLFSKNEVLCSLSALACQFLFLAAFFWKLILGVNVVRMIASLRYQNEDWMVKYRWAMIAVGYSVPLIIVAVSGGLFWSQYTRVSDNVCWIEARSGAFLTFLVPVGLIVLANTIALFFIANTLVRNYINTRKTRMNESNELIVFVQLLVSMGLTWIPSYLAIEYLAAMYLFVLFFPLQGLMMFLLVVVINKENRDKVSSFVMNSFLSMTSKSTSGTESKATYPSKSSGQSKATSETENLLAVHDQTTASGTLPCGPLLVTAEGHPLQDGDTKC